MSYIQLDHELVRCEVWAGLSANAVKLLIGIWDQYNGHNNGELRYSQKQAIRLLRCSPRTAVRAFAELQDAGLIEVVEKGSFAHKDSARKGMATTWRITAIKPTEKSAVRRFQYSFDGVPGDM